MSVGDPVHTCSERCPCHTGGAPREDFAEFGPERPVGGMKSLANRVTTDIHDSIDMQAELDRLRAALERLMNVTACIVSSPRRTHPGQSCVSYEHLPVATHDEVLLALSAARRVLAASADTGPLTAEQLADKLRDG